MRNKHRNSSEKGSVLVTVVILLAVAAFTIGSIMHATGNYMRMNRVVYDHERAFLLADGGLDVAYAEIASGEGDGIITRVESQSYFSRTNNFSGSDWGFETSAESLPGGVWTLKSAGAHLGHPAQCSVSVSEAMGLETIHALYATAVYSGNSSGETNNFLLLSGLGGGSDYVNGDIHINGGIGLSEDATGRLPEGFTDLNSDGEWNTGEPWTEAGIIGSFTNDPTLSNYNAFVAAQAGNETYGNGEYDEGEAFVDNYGNGVYDSGEPYNDLDGDGRFGFGDSFTDLDGDGAYDFGEEFVDTGNGEYDLGEQFVDANGNGVWDDATSGHYEGSGWGETWVDGEPPEQYEDVGNGVYDPGEVYTDGNGVYDPGTSDVFHDDRNGKYDYGMSASGTISGEPTPGVGQIVASEGVSEVTPPDLGAMYYSEPKEGEEPVGASSGWGHDIDVADADFDSWGRVMDQDDPAHIFRKNPTDVSYPKISGKDDYFLEDPTDSTYGDSHQYITVKTNGNDKVYYVDGNLYIHNPNSYDFMFREPGTKITIVANGNIVISDEFWYNGGTEDPQDMMALIALVDEDVENSGNIYLGDAVYGTGGDVHAMLYAENDFKDNNLDTSGQPNLSVFGNMTAGDQVIINRSGSNRTRLDITLDERIRNGYSLPPGLPPALSGERQLHVSEGWGRIPGSWDTPARYY